MFSLHCAESAPYTMDFIKSVNKVYAKLEGKYELKVAILF